MGTERNTCLISHRVLLSMGIFEKTVLCTCMMDCCSKGATQDISNKLKVFLMLNFSLLNANIFSGFAKIFWIWEIFLDCKLFSIFINVIGGSMI